MYGHTLTGSKQRWHSGWKSGPYSKSARGIRGTRAEGRDGPRGGGRKRRIPTKGSAKIDFCRCTGEASTGIHQVWQEEGSEGSGKRQVVSVDGAEASDTVYTQVIRGPH